MGPTFSASALRWPVKFNLKTVWLRRLQMKEEDENNQISGMEWLAKRRIQFWRFPAGAYLKIKMYLKETENNTDEKIWKKALCQLCWRSLLHRT